MSKISSPPRIWLWKEYTFSTNIRFSRGREYSDFFYKILESDKFETGNLIDKLLTIFPNEHRCKGNFSRFLSLTSGDDIKCKEKYKPWFTAPYRGMVAIASHNEIFDSKFLDVIHRRRILISCNFKPVIPDIYLNSKLASEIPELTRRLLEIPSNEILKQLNQEVKP